ncbi:hypothetical protein ANN_04646 [Periplaneta americana]|uniref:Uncharacterized protein n=1 Tax=Periplaneta americana TaxID=6978 RepID=A0ABQ8TAN5_PERAM|nr:hypothetical protein ANN_04646 [Periplaneta americana]
MYGLTSGQTDRQMERLFSIDGISNSEMVFGEMRLWIRHRLPDIYLTSVYNCGVTVSASGRGTNSPGSIPVRGKLPGSGMFNCMALLQFLPYHVSIHISHRTLQYVMHMAIERLVLVLVGCHSLDIDCLCWIEVIRSGSPPPQKGNRNACTTKYHNYHTTKYSTCLSSLAMTSSMRSTILPINIQVKRWKKFDIGKLNDDICQNEYKDLVTQTLDSQCKTNSSIEESWRKIKRSIHSAAEKILGYRKSQNRNGWFDEECQEALSLRNDFRIKMIQRNTRNNVDEFKEAKEKLRHKSVERKKEYEENLLRETQDRYSRNDSRKFFENIRKFKGGFQPRTTWCRDKNGNLVGETAGVLKRWTEHFSETMNPDINTEEDTSSNETIYFGPEVQLKEPSKL